jgi:DNA-binding transcriptional ArsR family regulator
MDSSAIFACLADPTRREILRVLAEKPEPVDSLAARFPVSRPAISKHLRKLKEAGLVSFASDGRSHVYRADLEALGEARAWIEAMWAQRLVMLKRIAEGDS